MYRLIYVSTADQLMNEERLVEILTKAREKNARMGVTGLLLYKDGNFMQLLEGEERAVRSVYEAIRRDSRHFDVTLLLSEPVNERLFPDWTMGFEDLSDPRFAVLPGFAPFKNIKLDLQGVGSDAAVCLDILRFFKETG